MLDTIKLASMSIPPYADQTESLKNFALKKKTYTTISFGLSCIVT